MEHGSTGLQVYSTQYSLWRRNSFLFCYEVYLSPQIKVIESCFSLTVSRLDNLMWKLRWQCPHRPMYLNPWFQFLTLFCEGLGGCILQFKELRPGPFSLSSSCLWSTWVCMFSDTYCLSSMSAFLLPCFPWWSWTHPLNFVSKLPIKCFCLN